MGTAAATARAMRDLPSALQVFALLVCNVLSRRAGHPHAAVKARQQALVGQALHIAAHGLQGDPQGVGQLLHRDGAVGLNDGKQFELSGVGLHAVFLSESSGTARL